LLLIFDEWEAIQAATRHWKQKSEDEGVTFDPSEGLVGVDATLRKVFQEVPKFALMFAGVPSILEGFGTTDSRFYGVGSPVELGPLDTDAIDRLVHQAEGRFKVTSQAKRFLAEQTGGQPYLVQLVLDKLYSKMERTGRENACMVDVSHAVRTINRNPSLFTNYGNDTSLMAHKELLIGLHDAMTENVSRAKFVDIKAILRCAQQTAGEHQIQVANATLNKLWKDKISGIVERSPSDKNKWRLTVGMLGSYLKDQHA
jgi:hypothetical protein